MYDDEARAARDEQEREVRARHIAGGLAVAIIARQLTGMPGGTAYAQAIEAMTPEDHEELQRLRRLELGLATKAERALVEEIERDFAEVFEGLRVGGAAEQAAESSALLSLARVEFARLAAAKFAVSLRQIGDIEEADRLAHLLAAVEAERA